MAADRPARSPALPISRSVLERCQALRERFQSPVPLPGFVAIADFLAPAALAGALADCRRARLATYCAYTATGNPADMRHEFCEPVADYYYASIHQRSVTPTPRLDALCAALGAPESLQALSDLTGVDLDGATCTAILIGWGPGTFVEPHTDADDSERPMRLVISLSLTERWAPRYEGTTVWAFEGVERAVWIAPQLNNAVLFVPSSRSEHWVEPIAATAPDRLRYTWTLFYQ